MDDLSGRGLGSSGFGLRRVDQGSSFTTCSARASRTGRGGVLLLLLPAMTVVMMLLMLLMLSFVLRPRWQCWCT